MPPKPLTPRQLEVARLAAAGKSTAAIAEQLGVAKGTAGVHLNQARAKAGTGSLRHGGRVRLAAWLSRHHPDHAESEGGLREHT